MKYIFLVLILAGCAKDPCLMHSSDGRKAFKVFESGKVEETNGLANLMYRQCNP